MTRGRLPFLLLLLVWPIFLALQVGDVYDECEHCHVAWLVGRMQQQPMRDFLQHHQPLLCDLLKSYYLVGGDGPEVMYFGRALTSACAVLFALGAFLLARNWARGQDGAASPGLFGAVLAVAPVLLMSLTLRTVVVIRPETVGLPLAALGLACWTWPTGAGRWAGVWRGLAAGALFGAAVFASPRFAVLGGAFVLLPRDRRRLFSLEFLPLFAAVAGGAAVLGGCQLMETGRLSDLYFNLEFSAITYKVGAMDVQTIPRLLIFVGELLLVAAWVAWRLDGPGRRRFLVQGGYFLLTTAVALASAWPHLYPQNYLAPVVWMGVMFACAAGRTEAARVPIRSMAPRWALVAAAVGLLFTLRDVAEGHSIVTQVWKKHGMLALLRPGEKVLLSPPFHPICALDATYYNTLIVDDDDHWGKVVGLARQRGWSLPDCDYLRDVLDQKPALVDDFLIRSLPEGSRARYRAVLDRDYTDATPPFAVWHRCFRLNDRLARSAAEAPTP